MKILVVDDHALIREGVGHLLKKLAADVVVLEAGNCPEAFELLDAHPDTSLILLDLGLPGMPGVEGLAIMRARHPDIPVVVLSSERDADTVLSTIRQGAMGFIPKTHASNVILGALQFVLVHRGIYLPPDIFLPPLAGDVPPAAKPARAGGEPPLTRPENLGLTPRQAEILYLVLQGKPNKTICRELSLAEGTVKTHLGAVLRSLNVTTRTEAVVAAHRLRLVFTR